MVCVRTSFENECVDQPAVEPDPHAHPGLGVVGLLGRYQIVEVAVQVRHREDRQHARDRFVFGGVPGRRHPAGLADGSDGHGWCAPERSFSLR